MDIATVKENVQEYGGLLSAAVRAITQIRAFLSSPTPDNKGALEQLKLCSTKLTQYCELHSWLSESKELHDHLTRVRNSLRSAFTTARSSKAGSDFAPKDFNIQTVKDAWLDTGVQWGAFRGFATRITYIEKRPVQFNADKTVASGPAWARDIFHCQNLLSEALANYDAGNAERSSLSAIAQQLRDLEYALDTHVGDANDVIRGLAEELSTQLREFRAGLLPLV